MEFRLLHSALCVAFLCLSLHAEAFGGLVANPEPGDPPARPGKLVGSPVDPDPDPPHPGRQPDKLLGEEPDHPCPGIEGAPAFQFQGHHGVYKQTAAGVAIGDPDHDGKLDYAWTAIGDDRISIYLGKGAGFYAWETGFGGTDVAFADFDADGKGDLIQTNMDDDTVTIKWQTLGGTEVFATGEGPTRVEVGDLNGDGYDDFATLDILSDTITVFLRNSGAVAFAGGFDSHTIPIGQSNDLKIADMNDDGALDLIYTSGTHFGNVKYRKNDGNGNFDQVVSIPMGSGHAETLHGLAIGDLNGDGRLDVVATRSNHEMVRVLATGTDTFGPPASAPTGNNPFQVVMDDFDVDGNLDFAMTHLNNNFISVYLGDGAGEVAGPWTYDFPGPTYGIVSGDTNRDGIPDLLVTAGDTCYIFRTQCPEDGGGIDGELKNPMRDDDERDPVVLPLDPSVGGRDDDEDPEREPSKPAPTAPRFRRGDVDQSADLGLADAVRTLNWLFLGGNAPSCQKAADANDDGVADIADVSSLLAFLFLGGSAPPAPETCGLDPTIDALSCDSYDACVLTTR